MSSNTNKTNSTPATRSSTRNKASAPRAGTSRATRAKAKTADTLQPVDPVALPRLTPVRKPLWNRDNALVPNVAIPKKQPVLKPKPKTMKQAVEVVDAEREPIKAFLRIRPQGSDDEPTAAPYLAALSETSVQMTDPSPSSSRLRPGSTQSTYTFSKVFLPETKQAEFFKHAALPLVRDLLDGQNGLLFAYGVTNSGKTYTIQGGPENGEGGLLPRTLDVIFNSVDGLHSDAPYRPVRLAGVEYDVDDMTSARSSIAPFDLPVNADQSILASVIAEQIDSDDRDETVVKVDHNYEYSVWVSYAEVYNEKVYDLLGVSSSDPPSPDARIPPSTSNLGFPRSQSTIGGFASCANLAALANTPSSSELNNPLLVKRKALALKSDPDGGKYIAGLREVRVRNAEEAKAIVKMGQINRRVFGTLANRASSRSHGIFTLKIMRVHKGCPNDPEAIQTARLSIVDLAGSERANNTHNTGERLKEAGNINKSLMVLGQCMEALRANQKKLAATVPGSNNVKLGLVPFRHSKLTELFQDFFVGDGRAVMIVNVNPYDTGFDENSHVMKFSALARDVSTTTVKRPPPSSIPRLAPNTSHRKVTISTGGKAGMRVTETHLDILEEDEEVGDDESDANDPLIDALFEQVEELRGRLFDAEMRCALIESETRDEVMKEMEERMMRMERMFTRRLMSEVEENQLKTDRKIDMLHQAGLIGVAVGEPRRDFEDLEDEVDVEESLIMDSDDDELAGGFSPNASPSDASESDYSPLARKGQHLRHHSPVEDNIRGPIGLFDTATEDEANSTSAEETEDAPSQDEGTESEVMEDDGEDSDWAPDPADDHSRPNSRSGTDLKPVVEIMKKTPIKLEPPSSTSLPSSSPEVKTVKKPKVHAWNMDPLASPLEYKGKKLSPEARVKQERVSKGFLEGTGDVNDSTIIIPNRQARKAAMTHAGKDAVYVSRSGEADEQPKKKKRTLRTKTVVMEDEIEAVTYKVAKVGIEGQKQGGVRRLAGGSN